MKIILVLCASIFTFINACQTSNTDPNLLNEEAVIATEKLAQVVGVKVSGNTNNYTFSVGLSSPDTGCKQYANWWEIITEDGTLIYRRILGHSHVNEQPFTRSGGAVKIKEDQTVIVRAHMNTTGYGTHVFIGSVKTGFKQQIIDKQFKPETAKLQPLPNGCAF